jgi:hypothetical protein
MAELVAKAKGFRSLRLAVLPHPIAGIPIDEVVLRGHQVADMVAQYIELNIISHESPI